MSASMQVPELHCRHCGASLPRSEYRCSGCRRFHRSLAIPFAAGGAGLFAIVCWSVVLTKVIPTYADLYSGLGRRFPARGLWVVTFSKAVEPLGELAVIALLVGVPVAGLAILPRRAHGTRPLLGGAVILLCFVMLLLLLSLSIAPFPEAQMPRS